VRAWRHRRVGGSTSIAPAGDGDELPRFGARWAVSLFLAFLLLGVLYTLPLVVHITDAVPFAAVPTPQHELTWRVQGDHLQFYYYLWLVRDRLRAGASIFRDPYQFSVNGPHWNLPNTFLPFTLLYLPLSLLGPRLAYNLLVLLSFPLTGLTTALLAHRYGLSRWAALVAGTVFACAPYRIGALLGGHPAGLAYFLVPLALWGLEGALAGSVGGGAWCGVALLSIALVEPHFLYFAALGLPLYVVIRIGLAGWTRDALRIGALHWAAALAVALVPAWATIARLRQQGWALPLQTRLALGTVVVAGILILWQCAAGVLRAGGAAADGATAARRSLIACLPWLGTALATSRSGARAALVALVLPVVLHVAMLLRAWRGWRVPALPLALVGIGVAAGVGYMLFLRQQVLDRSVVKGGRTLHDVLLFSPRPADLLVRVPFDAAHAVYLGAVALVLALLGIAALALRPPIPRRRILFALAPLLVLGVALSLGPRLTALPLFEAGFRLVPGWNFIRQPAKFQVLPGLALGVLAAAGVDALRARLRPGWLAAALAVALALAIAAEYHPWHPIGVTPLPTGGGEYDAIRAMGPRALYVPLWPGDSAFSSLYLYTTTLTQVPMLNGYSAWIDRVYVTRIVRPLDAVNVGAVGEAEYAALRRLGVRQVVLDRNAFPFEVNPFGPAYTLANLRSSPYLELARAPGADEDAIWIFRVLDSPRARPPERPVSPVGAFWEAEALARRSGVIEHDPAASNGKVVAGQAGRDRAGFLTFGPYRFLPAGRFRAVFWLRGHGAATDLQVTTDGGRRVLGAETVRPVAGPTFQPVTVPFVLDAPAPVEYRVAWDGMGRAAVDAISVVFADALDPAPSYDVEQLYHGLIERPDPDAHASRVGYAKPGRTPRDRVWRGPSRTYSAGRYRLWVRLKADQPTTTPVAWCGAQLSSVGPVVGGREIGGGELGEGGRYVELAVPFTVPRTAVLEFPCVYLGGVGVSFERLRIEGPF
jgi:hypothetical protein